MLPSSLGKALDKEGIAVRADHHCTQPILRRFGLESTVRPSLAVYTTCAKTSMPWSPRYCASRPGAATVG